MDSKELSIWKGRISRSLGLQQKQHRMWKDAVALYNCTYFESLYGSLELDRVDVNFANWYINNVIPMVYFRDPFIFVKAKHDKYSAFAETMETVLNHQWRELNLKQEFKRVIHSSLLMPPGWIKLGYTAKIGQDIGKIEEGKQKTLIDKIKNSITGMFRKEKDKSPEEQGILNEYIKEESIFASWIPSWNILMPEGYQVISQMPYLIEIEDVSKTDFIANPIYKNKANIKTSRELEESEGNQIQKVTYNKTSSGGSDADTNIIRLYHIWDRRSQKRYTISDEASDAHLEGDWTLDMDGFPYKPLYFEESLPSLDKSNPYPPNALVPILPQIIEQSQSRTQMVRHRRRAAAIILAQRGLLNEEDMNQLEESGDIEIKYISNLGAVQMTATPPLPSDVYKVDEVILRDLQMGTNMGQMMFQPMAGQRTATQARIGQSGLELKASARVDCVEDFTVLVAKCLAQTDWQFYDREKIAEIIGEEVTEDMWLPLPDDPKERKRIIQSEFQFRIDAGSAAPPKDETIDRKQLLDYISIIANIAPERIKKDTLIKKLNQKFKFDKMDSIVISSDEQEIQAAQKENELLYQNIPQVVGPNENHQIHVQVHSQMPPSEAGDVHIKDHSVFMGISQEGKSQQGDTRPPMKSTNPEQVRSGLTNEGDIYQEAENIGIGSGSEAM